MKTVNSLSRGKTSTGISVDIACVNMQNEINKDEARANAKLIAAAPEMLDVLQRLTDILELEQGESLDSMAARAIIKKATLN